MSRISVAVIGCGAIAQMMHIPHLRRLSDQYELAVAISAQRWPVPWLTDSVIPRWATDHRELLGPGIDGALVLTGGSHAPICMDLARAGKHISVEKPLCFTAAEGKELQAAVKEHHVLNEAGYMQHHRLLRGGDLPGEVVQNLGGSVPEPGPRSDR